MTTAAQAQTTIIAPPDWTASLIRRLRGKRTQATLARLLGVAKNSVWRWEADRVSPDVGHREALSRLAEREGFLADWELVGSMRIVGDLDEGSRAIASAFARALRRSAKDLVR